MQSGGSDETTNILVYDAVSADVESLCGGVTKNLTFHGMLKIDFQPEFWNSQMLSFPKMYNTMGSKVDGLAVREHFLSKNALKTAILADTILDHLTSTDPQF